MSKEKNEIRLIQMNKYIRPVVKETNSKEWVLNGQYNFFYQYIIDRFNGSSTNAAIINSYVDLMYGQGLQNLNTNLVDWVKFQKMITNTEIKKIVSDFELYGEAAIQIIKAKGNGKLPKLYHLPKENTAPKKVNDDNEIEGYYYNTDWRKATIENTEFLPILSEDSSKTESYVIRPYKAGKVYFSDPDYLAGLPYAELEEEIANYYVSHIKNGLSFGYIINVPDGNSYSPEDKNEMERKIREKLVGSSSAGKFIINFNGTEKEITVTNIEGNDAHKQWEFLVGEARQQLLTAHRVTSPMLFGIKDNTGLGNNADELDVAEAQLMKRVIQPKQKYITDALEDIAGFYDLVLDLKFKPLTDEEDITEPLEEKVQFKADHPVFNLINLGEDIDMLMYDLVAEDEVDYNENLEFESTGTARPNAKSKQDSDDILIRYKYTGNPSPERDFCKMMMRANKVYRKEDILQMGNKTVNPGFGMSPTPNAPYSIWLYKGGGLLSDAFPNGTCKHKWNRQIYLKKGVSVDVKSPLAKIISTGEARRKGYKVPTNDTKVSIAPHNMR
jgi:hypothetical protein